MRDDCGVCASQNSALGSTWEASNGGFAPPRVIAPKSSNSRPRAVLEWRVAKTAHHGNDEVLESLDSGFPLRAGLPSVQVLAIGVGDVAVEAVVYDRSAGLPEKRRALNA
jgi:hypothetical protein